MVARQPVNSLVSKDTDASFYTDLHYTEKLDE